MEHLRQYLTEADARFKNDAQRFQALSGDVCQLCLVEGADKRNLYIDCLCAVHEVVPEAICLRDVPNQRGGYYLRICKDCRGRFLGFLQEWRNQCLDKRDKSMNHDGYLEEDKEEKRVCIRRNGKITHMSVEEFRNFTQKEEKL